jgi:hypothetical protein
VSVENEGKFLCRDNPLFAFTPAAWASRPVRCEVWIPEDEVASAVVSATYFAGLSQPGLRDRMMTLSRIHTAATLVSLYADQTCPGSRPAGAGDLLSAAAYRASDVCVSDPRSHLWGAGVHQAVARALATGDEDIAILVLVDIMLLVPEVTA